MSDVIATDRQPEQIAASEFPEDFAEANDFQTPADSLEQEDSIEVPRPALTLKQAAAVLGKSLRAIERSVLGRWGNKLPEGWMARKVRTEAGSEWRIIPPPGFRIRQTFNSGSRNSPGESQNSAAGSRSTPAVLSWDSQNMDHPSIIIDRSDEVERLLRELLQVQRQLSEERRLRMEDLRMLTQMQGSMRLLEDKAYETTRLKNDLEQAKRENEQLQQQYREVVNRPWWRFF
jgi:hypothetical protein